MALVFSSLSFVLVSNLMASDMCIRLIVSAYSKTFLLASAGKSFNW